jgi:hypothetical protein
LILNDFNLAAILAGNWPEDFDALRENLAPWTLLLVLGGGKRFPEERIQYEEEALQEVAGELSIASLPTSIPGRPGLERQLPDMLRNAWPKDKTYWKFAYQGSSQDLFFIAKLYETPAFVNTVSEIAARYGYPFQDLGFYIQPMAYGGACHFESNFFYDPTNPREVSNIARLHNELFEAMLDEGAFFSRPYGPVAGLVYNRAAGYTEMLKRLKNTLDPNNVMAPGRLCF